MSTVINDQAWSLNDRVEALLAQAEHDQEQDPDLGENSAMVLVGDVYVLREEAVIINDGWGSRHYSCDPGGDPI